MIVEVGAGQVRRERLTECQRAGEEGRLVGAMAAFVKWVAGQYAELQQSLRNRVLQIRRQGGGGWGHARTPAALAELQGGWEMFLQFAMEVGALNCAEKDTSAPKELCDACAAAIPVGAPGPGGVTVSTYFDAANNRCVAPPNFP